MSDQVKWHAAERVDLVDLDGQQTLARGAIKLQQEKVIHDRRSLIVRGFRIELPTQSSFPGRITIHGGVGWDPDGQVVFNEDQLDVTRTITLEGASTDFYVEIEFIEGSGAVDSRAFWDSTVDQGADVSGDALPDGQEFASSVSTRDVPDWRVVQPVSTTGFARDTDPTSTRIPLIHLRTDNDNEITSTVNTNLTTEKAATTLLQQLSTTRIQVQNPQLMPPSGVTLRVGEGAGTQEDVTVVSVDRQTGIVVTGVLSNSHVAGEIVRAQGASAADFVVENDIGLYRVREVDADQPNHQVDRRDMLFRGDEIHGDILLRGHGSTTDRSDVNLQSLKDYVDFLAAKVQELSWGLADPHTSMTDSSRTPPGVDGNSFPTTPRHYDRASGVAPSRTVTITVGNGTDSFGDFNGTTEAVLQAAHDNLPAAGGRIFIKKGTYAVGAADWDITNAGTTIIEADRDAIITSSGGVAANINTGGRVILKGLVVQRGTTTDGIRLHTTAPDEFQMHGCVLTDVQVDVRVIMPTSTSSTPSERTVVRDCVFTASHADMVALSLWATTAAGSIRGWFTNCQWDHASDNGTTDGPLIDATARDVNTAKFSNCDFFSTSATASAFEMIHLGGTGNPCQNVQFVGCKFGSAANTTCVRVIGSANADLTFRDCNQVDAIATFLNASGVLGLTVDHFYNTNVVPLPSISLTNCTSVKISNVVTAVSSSTSLTTSNIILTSSSGTLEDVLIEGCTLFGDTGANDDTTGIIFDLAGGTAVRDVRVINNSFQTQEVGIYLENSGAAAAYRNISIRGNVFIDEGVSSTVATNQKIGIFADSVSTKSGWVISDNIIRNCNPANTDTVSGDTRAGILIKGSANSNFTVANNAITNIGSGGSELADTMGIRFDSLGSGTVTGNNVDTIRGTNAAGMRFGAGVTAVSNISVTGNRIESITATGAGLRVYGIVWGSASELTITGNTFDSFLVTGGGGAGGAVISADQLGGASTNVSIYNNTCAQSTAGIDSIHIQALNQQRISISGNTFGSGLDRGILLEGPGGGTIDTISISGNSITCGDRCVDTNLLNVVPAASCERISVTGNSFLCTDADSTNIVLSRGQIVTCSGNSCDNTGTHTVTRGQNIFASGTIMFTIISNICRITGGSALNDVNVELTAGCDKFTIVGNIFEGTPAKSIWFSGLVASGQAAFIGLNPGNTAHDDGTGSNIEIVATTPSTGTADMILGAWYV